jgi:hypothetical protein
MATAMRVTAQLENLGPTLRLLRQLPKDATTELRQANLDISRDLARRIARSAATPQEAALAHTVKARYDRVPKVAVGGSRRAWVWRTTRGRAPGTPSVAQPPPTAGQLIRGVEYGANRSWRFPRSHRRDGYWVGPAWRRVAPEAFERWADALTALARKWGSDG